MNILSFALWGTDDMYYAGAVKNCLAARQFYRGWLLWFHLAGGSVPPLFATALRALGAETFLFSPSETGHENLYHRILPVLNPRVDRVLFRDCDSVVNAREAACVKEWTDSDAPVHGIRDHRAHTAPLMGGMWGCKPKALLRLAPDFEESITRRMRVIRDGTCADAPRAGRTHYSDQVWLREYLWPLVKDVAMVHDNWRRITGKERPVPHQMKDKKDFIGQAYRANGEAVWKA